MYGLIGKKLGHSFSEKFFTNKFAKEGIDETYKLLPIPSIDHLPKLIEEFPELKGLNVTIPYKQEVIPYLTSLSPEAHKIGAVNVILIERKLDKLSLKGYNSDCIGFKDSIKKLLRPDIKKALILGTGGASKAVEYVLKDLGIIVTFVSRNPIDNQVSYKELNNNIISENLLIINATPLGMFPEISKFPPIPYEFLTPRHICYDLVYNPGITEFMKKSKKYGAKIKNGLEMLEKQALVAWRIWNNNV